MIATLIGNSAFRAADTIVMATLSHDGRRLAVATKETLELFDAISGERQARFAHDMMRQLASACAFSPDDTVLVCAGSAGVARFDVANLGMPHVWPVCDGKVRAIAFSPDGTVLACAWKSIQLWTLSSATLVRELKGSRRDLTNIAFSPDGKQLVAAGDAKLRIYTVATGKAATPIDSEQHLVRYAADGLTAVTATWSGVITVWDVATWTQRATWPVLGAINSIELAPGLVLATGDSQQHHEGLRFRRFDLASGAIVTDETLDEGYVGVICGVTASTVYLYSPQSAVVVRRPAEPILDHGAAVRTLAVSPDGATLASAGDDGTTVVWQLDRGAPRARIVVANKTFVGYLGRQAPHALAFDRDGLRLAIGAGDMIAIVEVATGRIESQFTAHDTGETEVVAFSPDGTFIASCNDRVLNNRPALAVHGLAPSRSEGDARIALIYLEYFGKELRWLDDKRIQMLTHQRTTVVDLAAQAAGPYARHDLGYILGDRHAASADGETIVDADHSTIQVWRTATGQTITQLDTGELSSLALSSDGSRLAIGRWPAQLSIVSIPTGEVIAVDDALPGVPSCLTFTPHADAVIAGHYDGMLTLHRW